MSRKNFNYYREPMSSKRALEMGAEALDYVGSLAKDQDHVPFWREFFEAAERLRELKAAAQV